MDVKQAIIASLKKAVQDIEIKLEHPADLNHGDYSCNVALVAAKQLKKNPLDVAEEIVSLLNTKYRIPNTDRIEAVAPGFINFYISKDYLVDQLQEVLKEKEHFGQGSMLKDKKIMVEFTDPNPFKEFHIGHLYSNIVGESLCRILESQGARVKRVNYQGDVGLHVAKALWGLLEEKASVEALEKKPLEERIRLIGQAYAKGASAYEADEQAKQEINQINKKIYALDESIKELYQKGRAWSLEYFEAIYKRLGTKFEGYYFESVVGKIGLEFVKSHMDIFKESEGAVIFPGEDYGLHNRVFINSLGLPTYEAKELGLAPTKYKDFPYDQSIIVTGNEINAYFHVLLKALSLINPDLAVKTKHIGHGMVRLPSGKMSSRTGNVITGEWLLSEAKKKIEELYSDMDAETVEKVTIGSIKYALLKSGIGRDISFSFEESVSIEGNSGPYLQYTYARTQSVLGKSKTSFSHERFDLARLEPEELALLRTLHRFPEVVAQASQNFSPSIIATYLFDLAQNFNFFYQKHSILDSKQKEFRLALTSATGHVIKNGLHILGIKAPERM